MKEKKLILFAIGIAIFINTKTSHAQDAYVSFKDFEDVILKLTVSLAKAGQYDEARRELKKLEDYETYMKAVIPKVYDANASNTERAVELLYSVNCDAYANGAVALFEEIRNHGHLTKPETLMFANQLEQPDCITSGKVNVTINLMKPYVDAILNQWAANIRSGRFHHIYRFVEFSDEQYIAVNPHIPALVQKAVKENTTRAINATLAFVKDLPFLRFVGPGYITLIKELKGLGMVHSEMMMMVTYRVYETMAKQVERIANYSDITEIFIKVREEVPPVLLNMFVRDTCTIKNIYWKEYLHASKDVVEGGNGAVFTWLTGYKINGAEWILEPELEEGSITFQVKNKHFSNDEEDNYLCESSITNKAVICGGVGALSKWNLMPVVWKDINGFKFKNMNKMPKMESSSLWGSLFSSKAGVETEGFLQATTEHNVGLKKREVVNSYEEDSSHWQIDCF